MTEGLPRKSAPPERSYSLYEGIRYQDYWDGESRTRQEILERYIISGMLPASGRRIIDLGCGYGRLAPLYLDRFDQVVLYDGSLSLLRDARKTLGNQVLMVAGDVGRLPFKSASFDCVLTIRVLQHIPDLRGPIEEMSRVIAGDGTLIFSYHNKSNPRRITRYLADRSNGNPFSKESVEIWPTMFSHHPRQVEALLRAARFSRPEYRGAVVVDSWARIAERTGHQTTAGAGWAPFMGRFKLAPWLIGKSFAQEGRHAQACDSLENLFECPLCRGCLLQSDHGFECSACHRHYPISDGIMDFRCPAVQ